MVLIPVLCPHCQSDQIIKGGTTKAGKQRYKCQNADCPYYSFQLNLVYKGRLPEIKAQIVDMALNGSGIRDTARVLKISPTTVLNELKKTHSTEFSGKAPTPSQSPTQLIHHNLSHRSGAAEGAVAPLSFRGRFRKGGQRWLVVERAR